MRREILESFICPEKKSFLRLRNEICDKSGEIISGELFSENSDKIYKIIDGIPNFTLCSELEKNEYAINLFKQKAASYDKYQHLSFETFYENEADVRNSIIDKLNLKSDSRILELNAGTGRDSILIAERISGEAELHLQDISLDMIDILREKVGDFQVKTIITQGNACKLPYPDNFFDAIYSFGGVGMSVYANNREIFKEIVRVTKDQGRVAIGGLSLAPWLKNTEFGKILINHNPHYANNIILEDMPVEAKNLCLQWIMSGAGFSLDFTVDENATKANFDYEIPGARGGTHKTRYYGMLEGVTPEAKELALRLVEKEGVSMHRWLDELVKKEAKKVTGASHEVG